MQGAVAKLRSMVVAFACSSGETCRVLVTAGGVANKLLQWWSAERSALCRLSTWLRSAYFFVPTVTLLAVVATATHAITLQRAENELVSNNVDVAIARAAIDGAEANVTIAGQLQNPTLSVSTAQYSPIGGLGAGRPDRKQLDTIVGISVPIERGDKAALKREQALGQLTGTKHDLRDIRRQQRLVLWQAYYDLKLAEERRAIAGRTWEISVRALDAADRRVTAGDLALVDRHRLSVEALRGANEVITADADMRDKRVALAVVMGRRSDGQRNRELPVDDLTADDPWPLPSNASALTPGASLTAPRGAAVGTPLDTPLAASIGDMMRGRADIAAADARVAAADAGRAVAKSLRVRDVTVGAQVERQPANLPGLMFGVNVSIPLYVRYGYEGEIARAEADYAAALVARQKIVMQAEADAAKALSQLEAARQRLMAFESDIRPAAKRALDASEFAYARGASNLTDVLDARRTWHAIELDLAVARADHAKAIAAWRAATRWESDNGTP